MTTRKTREPARARGARRAGRRVRYPSARLHAELRAQVRTAVGRKPQPTASIIDSQSVRAADTVPRASRGWDNPKRVNGRKRHIAVDVMGLVLDVLITAASVQDRQGARPLLWNTHRACRYVRLVWAAPFVIALSSDGPDRGRAGTAGRVR